MKKILYLFTSALFIFACENESNNEESDRKNKEESAKIENLGCGHDVSNHTFSNIDEVNTTHLHLEMDIDFDNSIINGVARHTMNNTGVDLAIFDINGVDIQKITLGEGENEKETTFKIGEHVETLGSPLEVDIDKNTTFINIYYTTTENSNALDFLSKELTASGKFPYLYTQGQPILTRTWIPTQDTPANRITYSANVKVPSELLAIMSAKNPTERSEDGVYNFEMNQAIPSYLIALAVGEMEYHAFSENSGVYAEPDVIESAAYEFADIPKMIDAAENLYGKYLWDNYDVVVLPYAFPFGGMENPRLTFATPTLIAGDRSLTSVIAHELAHSWSGNLVTNSGWNDIWLNEGFTVYFENRIMEEIYGKEIADMLFLVELQELEETIESMFALDKPEDTKLKLDLECRDPDEGLTDVAYIKGALFLKTLEKKVGKEKFDVFLTQYFQKNKFKSLSTESFVEYLEENLIHPNNIDFNYKEWIYEAGIPDNAVKITSERFENIQQIAKDIKNGGSVPNDIKLADKTTQEWIAFIRKFDRSLEHDQIEAIDKQFDFAGSGNAELMTEWFVLNIMSGYKENYDELEQFLMKVGRRKFLKPLYNALALNKDDKEWALKVYKNARPNYHAVSFNTIDNILDYKEG